MSKILLFFLSVILIGFFSNCNNQNPVPEVYVNYTIQLSDPNFLPLTAVGGSIYIPYVGNKGIIVVQSNFEEFLAYDATCTYDPMHEWGRVMIEPNNILAKDTVCGSQYSLMLNGIVNDGPAGLSLMQYVVDYNANLATLHIHN